MDTSKTLQLKIILGSTRPSRFSEKAAAWVAELAKKDPVFAVDVLDLSDYPMPYFEEPQSPSGMKRDDFKNENVKKWWDKISEGDAFLVVGPEYNHGYSAVLKNAFDYIYTPWNNKAIGYVSYGSVGGGRSVEQMRAVAIELQMAPIRSAVHIQSPWGLLDEKGELKAGALDGYTESAQGVLVQLAWWAKALKAARANA